LTAQQTMQVQVDDRKPHVILEADDPA
jgi:hypothetical protein